MLSTNTTTLSHADKEMYEVNEQYKGLLSTRKFQFIQNFNHDRERRYQYLVN
jgi:hypothetical protein